MKRRACALALVVGFCFWIGLGTRSRAAAEDAPAAEAASPAEPAAVPEPPAAAGEERSRETPAGFRLIGELLFLKPTLDDTSFVIVSATAPPPAPPFSGPVGQRVSDDFGYEPAFRIGAGYQFAESGRSVELGYTRLAADASESVTGAHLWATRGSPRFGASFLDYPGSAAAQIDVDYQRIDAHVSQPWQLSDLGLALQFGFEWAQFRVGEEYTYANSANGFTGRVSNASRSWGIGPDLGLALSYAICRACGIPGTFSLAGGAAIGVLFSETDTRAGNSLLGSQTLSVRDDQTSRLLPAIHARVGLGYEVPVTTRVRATLGVGYQLDSYLRGLARSSFVDDVARGQSTTDYYDFDLQGVFVSFGVVF